MSARPQLRLRPSIVISFDLLGLERPEVSEERSLAALAFVEREFGSQNELARELGRRLFVTAHRAMRVVPIKTNGTLVFWELLDIVHHQADLIPLGILLRGAVTLGDVGVQSDCAIGPGVLKAERLRDAVADVPRVIVDPRLILEVEQNADLRAHHHTVMMELGYIRKLLRQDADGLWFVDYLRAFESEVDEPPFYVSFLEAHARLVEQRLEACGTLDREARAVTWLWRYHNRVVEACYRRKRITKEERSRLRVPARGPLLYAFPPSARAPE